MAPIKRNQMKDLVTKQDIRPAPYKVTSKPKRPVRKTVKKK